jgi:hypothetical protein
MEVGAEEAVVHVHLGMVLTFFWASSQNWTVGLH